MEFSISMEKQDFNTLFGEFVKAKRLEMDWTQPDLAAKLGNNFQNVSSLERGEFGPSLYWCVEILAPAFGLSFTEFWAQFRSYMESGARIDG